MNENHTDPRPELPDGLEYCKTCGEPKGTAIDEEIELFDDGQPALSRLPTRGARNEPREQQITTRIRASGRPVRLFTVELFPAQTSGQAIKPAPRSADPLASPLFRETPP